MIGGSTQRPCLCDCRLQQPRKRQGKQARKVLFLWIKRQNYMEEYGDVTNLLCQLHSAGIEFPVLVN